MTNVYPNHEKAIAYARHSIGVYESPNGSNRGPIQRTNPDAGVDFFEQHDFVAGVGYPWCAAFWLTCWAESGHPFPYRSPSAHALGDWAKQHGMARPVNQLVPGDGCDWNEGSGHLSMFESYDPVTGTVHTIDGNWDNKVMRATHKVSNLRVGFHVPEKHTDPVPKTPYWVIATSHNGHKKILFSDHAKKKKILGLIPRFLHDHGSDGITIKRSRKKPS